MAQKRSDDMWLVAYALARCGEQSAPPAWLGTTSWNQAYAQFYEALGEGREPRSFANSLKNARDTFDPYVAHPSRVGWRAPDHSVAPPRSIVKTILEAWTDRPEAALQAAVFGIRDRRSGKETPLELLADAGTIRRLWERWLDGLTANAETVSAGRWWHAGVRLHVRSSVVDGELGAVGLSLEEDATRWTLELNPLPRPGDANMLTGIGRDAQGRYWLLRQGRLHPEHPSEPRILEAEFRRLTGLAPTPVQVGLGPEGRDWYRVCQLDADSAEMLAATTLFVARCDMARRSRTDALPSEDVLGDMRSLLAADETMGFLLRRARAAESERHIWKQHAAVWSGLRNFLAQAGLGLDKVRPAPGYEVDGVIALDEPVLVEIKTAVSAVDIYTAVGQLMLYRRLICPQASHRLVLVLPTMPSAPLQRALRDLDFRICVFTCTPAEGGGPDTIVFDQTLSHLWGGEEGG